MMKTKVLLHLIFSLVLMFLATQKLAQNVGIGETDFTPDDKSILEIQSANKGLLIPRMTEAQRLALNANGTTDLASKGLQVYQTDGAAGVYVWSGKYWCSEEEKMLGSIQGFAFAKNPATTGWAPMSASSAVLIAEHPAFASLVTGGTVPATVATTSGANILFEDWNNEGVFVRGRTTAGTFQNDATAANGLNFRTHINGSGGGTGGGFDRRSLWGGETTTTNTGSQSNLTRLVSQDPETRPVNRSVIWHIYFGVAQ